MKLQGLKRGKDYMQSHPTAAAMSSGKRGRNICQELKQNKKGGGKIETEYKNKHSWNKFKEDSREQSQTAFLFST